MRNILVAALCVVSFSSPLMAVDDCELTFCKLDKNNKGTISKKDFLGGEMKIDRGKVIRLFPGLRDAKQLNEWDLRERLFVQMDRNHDGLLSRDEWRRVAPNILQFRF